MNIDDSTKVAVAATGVVGAILTYMANVQLKRQQRREGIEKTAQETTQQRVDREATERASDLDRYDKGVWSLIKELREEVERLKAEMTVMRTDMQREQLTSGELRADLAQASITIRSLTRDNERLTARVAELEGRQG